LIFDTSLVSQVAPKLTDKTLDFGIVGLFHKANQTYGRLVDSIESLPEHTEVTVPKFQFFVSDALMNSYIYTLPNVSSMTETLSKDDEFPYLDTTSLNEYFPGLSTHFGKDLPVELHYKVNELGNFKSFDEDHPMSLNA
jgi:hypothetical protein